MKMFKKLLAVALAGVLALSVLTACDSSKSTSASFAAELQSKLGAKTVTADAATDTAVANAVKAGMDAVKVNGEDKPVVSTGNDANVSTFYGAVGNSLKSTAGQKAVLASYYEKNNVDLVPVQAEKAANAMKVCQVAAPVTTTVGNKPTTEELKTAEFKMGVGEFKMDGKTYTLVVLIQK